MNRFQVELVGIPGDEVAFVKAMRRTGRLTLTDALLIFDHARRGRVTVLVAGVERAIADEMRQCFADAGVRVVVETSALRTPMVCRPQADRALEWATGARVVPF